LPRIRITGGVCRSRLIDVAEVAGLRPTPDRVRVTLFNWLGQDLTDQRCLDLFAGSGVLGFEAASRGATTVTLVERDRRACATLRRNAAALKLGQVEILCVDALKFAVSSALRYDVVFLDPPYRLGLIDQVAPHLVDLTVPGARIYVESEVALDGLGGAGAWQLLRRDRAGQVCYHLFGRD
jgi:16S rRNA (guanine966-N2)-methyltransferase